MRTRTPLTPSTRRSPSSLCCRWVDILPPRGPYLWPCNPSTYKITEPVHLRDESGGGAKQTAAAQAGESATFLSQPPQMCYGWYVSSPPPTAPFFWSCLPPGYTLVAVDALNKLNGRALPLTTTTRQGNVTLTLPNTSAALSSDLSAPTSSSSISAFYPQSKMASVTGQDSLSFLNLSQQDDSAAPTSVPLPVRSPALEGLANVAVPGGGSGDFSLDQVAEPGEAEEPEEGAGRRGKRKRTGKGR